MKNCTQLWREARFQVKSVKNWRSRSTFGSWMKMIKSARRCGAKHMSKSKCTKHVSFGALLGIELSAKVYAVLARSTFPSQNVESTTCSDHFFTFRIVSRGRDSAPRQKWAKSEGFVANFQKRWQAWDISRGSGKMHSRGRRNATDMFIRDVRRPGRWFHEKGCIMEHQIFRFAKNDFAWQVQHFVWPGFTFSWQAQHFTQMEWKNRKTHWYEAVSPALNFPFLKDVSAELLRFWCCQLWKMK